MADSFLGEIRIFSFNYAPAEWAFCNGVTLSIQQNAALYSILGITYGGDGKATFQLPDLMGNVAAGVGTTPDQALGKVTGAASVTVSSSTMASHNHQVMATHAIGTALTTTPGATSLLTSCANTTAPYTMVKVFSDADAPNVTLNSSAIGIGPVGSVSVAPHENRQPYLALNFCISLAGTYPSYS